MKQRVLVDSRNRQADSASTSDFRVTLQTPLHGVSSADLRQLIISDGIYNVDDHNGQFLLSAVYSPRTGLPVTLNTTAGYVPAGYYTLSQFASALEKAIAATFAAGGVSSIALPWITCGVNAERRLELYGVSNDLHFSLSFPSVLAANVFGFPAVTAVPSSPVMDTDGNTYQWIQSPQVMGLETLEYLLLRSPQLGNTVQTARGVPAYDIIPIPDRIKPLVYTRYEAAASSSFAPRTISELQMALIKPNGKVIDLRGNDVALVLELTQGAA